MSSSAGTHRNHSLVPLPTLHAITAWVPGSHPFGMRGRGGTPVSIKAANPPRLQTRVRYGLHLRPAPSTGPAGCALLALIKRGVKNKPGFLGFLPSEPRTKERGADCPLGLHMSYAISPEAFPPQGLGLLIKQHGVKHFSTTTKTWR